MTEKFIIGLVGAPFGVNGFIKVRPCSGEIDHLLKLKSVILSKDGKERLFQIDDINSHTEGSAEPVVFMRFAGYDSPETVKALTGAQLLAPREQAASLGDGEFYIEDLKGLPVLSDKGEIIGHVTDIIEGGGGELIEIKLLLNGLIRLVPFRKEFFSEINPDKGRLVLHDIWILDLDGRPAGD
ncbi:MAG: ribosome maturation factor RimM [Treponema sp.]|nr:ribosome maturation factor RimM [Treponema sp.]